MSIANARSRSNLTLALIALSATVISCTMCRGFGGNQASDKTRILNETIPAGLEHAYEDDEIYRPYSFRIIMPESGRVLLGDPDGEPVDLSAFRTKLKEFLGTRPAYEHRVYLIASANVPTHEVLVILDELRNQDVGTVKLVTSGRTPEDEESLFKEIPAPNKVLAVQPQNKVVSGGPPNPLTLIVAVGAGGMTLLNNEPHADLNALTNKLTEIFKLRENNGVLRENTNEVEKTVIVDISEKGPDLKYGDVLKVINAVKGAGAEPIALGDKNTLLQIPTTNTLPRRAPMPSPSLRDMPQVISGGVLNGKAISLPKPPYPAAARAVNASGAVSVQVTVDVDGKIIQAAAVSGHPLLRPAATAAARSAVLAPTLLGGKPVKVTGVLTYNFVP